LWYVLFCLKKSFFLNLYFFFKPRFCNQLELEEEILIRKTAIHIAERANEICNIQGRAPSSVAGASIYMACLAACEKKTKKG
jgi:transcription initiation factor TFIIIB Brf1 subunit/transcription initiation factor TFIIB